MRVHCGPSNPTLCKARYHVLCWDEIILETFAPGTTFLSQGEGEIWVFLVQRFNLLTHHKQNQIIPDFMVLRRILLSDLMGYRMMTMGSLTAISQLF